MSHVNRNDRLSRRLLGFTGRCEAVETQNKELAVKVADLDIGQSAFTKMLATYQEALVQAREQIDALKARVSALERMEVPAVEPAPLASETVQEAIDAIPATQD